MLTTAFTTATGCRLPLQLAGMPGLVTPELAAAVAKTGALAMFPGALVPAEALASQLDEVARIAGCKAGVNFLMPFVDREAVEAAAPKSSVVEFFYGDPDPELVGIAKRAGALACWQTGSLEEAKAAEDAGCDLVVVQGIEAGGHVRGRLGLFALLERVLPALRIPVIAAGGIASGRTMAAALAAGASAVRVGTRFLAATEAGTHPVYLDALLAARAEDTELTEAFDAGWPDAPHRVLRSSIEAARASSEDIVGEQSHGELRLPVQRFSPAPPTRHSTGKIEAMALYAGHSVDGVTRVAPAADIVRELCEEAEESLARLTSRR